MIKAVIFDVDGTLIDSVDLHAEAWQRALAHFGHEVPFVDVRQQIGKGGDQLLPVFFSPEEMREKGEEIEKWRGDLYKSEYMHRVRPFPRVRELFLRLKNDGKQIALASSAKGDEVKYYKEVADVADLVDAKTSSDDAEKSKPHPDIFQAALARLEGVRAEEAIVIGDTPYDAQAAGKAGISTIGLLCGGFPEEQLKEAGCIAIYPAPADLLDHYEESVLYGRKAA
jgi:HAD superfamily hydrolase (TIGR01509 family)